MNTIFIPFLHPLQLLCSFKFMTSAIIIILSLPSPTFLSVCLSVWVSLCLCFSLSLYVSICVFLCMYLCVSLCVSVAILETEARVWYCQTRVFSYWAKPVAPFYFSFPDRVSLNCPGWPWTHSHSGRPWTCDLLASVPWVPDHMPVPPGLAS